MQTDETQTDDTQAESLGTRSEITELGGCKRRMKASVPQEKVIEELDRNYDDLAKTVQIPGFRKGRVPRPLLESRYGEEIESEVKQSIVSASFTEVIEEKELQVFSSPKFENVTFDKDSDLTYEVEFEVRPDFELPSYKGVEVAVDTPEFSEDEVTAEIDRIRRQYATIEPASPADIGEDGYLGGSYTLFVDDAQVKKVDKVTFQPSSGVLEHFLVEDLSKRVADWDWSSEDPMVFDVTVPDRYPDEVLRGKSARLEFVVSEGYDVKLPELDDELAKKADHETLDELKAKVRENLETSKERERERKIEEAVLDQLASRAEMDVPEALIEAQTRRNRASQAQLLEQQGFSSEEIEAFLAAEEGETETDRGASEDSPEASDGAAASEDAAAPAAKEVAGDGEHEPAEAPVAGGDDTPASSDSEEDIRQTARKYFILEAIAEKEKIFVTEQQVDEKLVQMAQQYGMPPSRLRGELESSGRLTELRQSLKHDKVREFLRSKAKVTSPAGNGTAEAGAGDATEGGDSETADET